MTAYLDAARRHWPAILLTLALTWGAGAVTAFHEYTTSYEADATVWTDRQSARFESPGMAPLVSTVSPAQEQAGLLGQMLQTRSFLQDVAERAGVTRPASADERTFFADIGKRFEIEVLGNNVFRLAYRASDPRTGARMIMAALEARQEREFASQTAASTAAATYYRAELANAQRRADDAQSALAAFDATHAAPLAAADDYQQRQLRAALEEAKARVGDLKARIDGSSLVPSMLTLTDELDFQVLDRPLEQIRPSGGTRAAAMMAGSAGAAGAALVAMLVIGGALLGPRRPSAVVHLPERRERAETAAAAT